MSYSINEMFYSLQGEGARTGRSAVFVRFTGCNLWSGREVDRATAACRFCDTEFLSTGAGGGRHADAPALAKAAAALWPEGAGGTPYVVCTGGEPLLQLDAALIEALQKAGFEVAVETNGTCAPPPGIDWLCVSPKAGAPLALRHGDELKVVHPQPDLDLAALERLPFRHFFLQPMAGPDLVANTRAAVRYCLDHPRWCLSLQTHKILGIP